ncbi:Nickel uptake substrate-specific transmembrane region [Caulifigura coniformis]|uniref:Nickel uptake substrate-specific transmembrane region n=1 Tax=Caulifigura coniformis TaxID=2527983 RepID=A0A517SI12_9PLAN|nr:hypothetical protein [Caulifigura coniformis]QDT55764.1 Nickel uptake substrate-specific transmembrane region [Caulifigura coniformis]
MNRPILWATLAVLSVAVIWTLVPGRSQPAGAPKVPVAGRVLVNGKPAAGVTVRFQSDDGELAGQDRQPVATTDDQGNFQLSSHGNADGAAPGNYVVTFFWPTNPIKADKDRLRGRFMNAAQSRFKVSIGQDTALPPFELEIPEAMLLPADEAATKNSSALPPPPP